MRTRSKKTSSIAPVSVDGALPAADRTLLLATALHDRAIPPEWLERLGASDEQVDEWLARGWLAEAAGGLVLGVALEREALVRAAPWSQKRRVHRLLGEAASQRPAQAESAARHLAAAGLVAAAAEAYFTAAETHCRHHRHVAAQRCFLAGLELLPVDAPDTRVVRALQGLASCAALGSALAAAIETLRAWAHTPPWSERPAVRLEAHLSLAGWLAHEGRHVESARLRRSAARDLAALGRDAEAAAASLAAGRVLAYALQLTLAREAAEAARHAADRVRDPALQAQTSTLCGAILTLSGDTRGGRAELERALALALRHQLTGTAAEAYRLLATVQEYSSCYRDQQQAIAKTLIFCRGHDEVVTAGLCLGCLAYSFFRSGNWKRSEDTARRVIADRGLPDISQAVAAGVLGLLHAHRGENRPAARHLRRSLETTRRMGVVGMDFFNLLGLAVVAETAGELDEARRHITELFEIWRETEDCHDAIPGLSLAVTLFAEAGEREQAWATAEALDKIAARTANPEATGAAHAAAGELRLVEGRFEAAADAFARAQEAYEQRDLSVELIRVRLRLGVALRQCGRLDSAVAALEEARRRARRLGARPLGAKADALLLELRSAPVEGKEVSAWDTLSGRQRDVARHLAQGLANKEIAARLGISVRTAEMHVAGVLARLDCRSRAQAATRLAASLA